MALKEHEMEILPVFFYIFNDFDSNNLPWFSSKNKQMNVSYIFKINSHITCQKCLSEKLYESKWRKH